MSHQAHHDSKPLGGGHVPPGAKRLKQTNTADIAWRDHPDRQTHAFQEPTVIDAIAWRCRFYRQALQQYMRSTGL